MKRSTFFGVVLIILGIVISGYSGLLMISKSIDRAFLRNQKSILNGESTQHEVVNLGYVTNWVVVTNHSAPAGTFEVVVSGIDNFNNRVLAHGFSSKKIDSGIPVKFIQVRYSVMHSAGPSFVHFVEPQ